jgi:hypothetical protein
MLTNTIVMFKFKTHAIKNEPYTSTNKTYIYFHTVL